MDEHMSFELLELGLKKNDMNLDFWEKNLRKKSQSKHS